MRQRQLQALLDHPDFAGNKAALGRALDLKSGAYIRQLLVGERPITEKTIEKMVSMQGGKYRPILAAAPVVAQERRPAYEVRGRSAPADGYVRLPLLGEASAGPGRSDQMADEVVEYIDVLESWVRRQWAISPTSLRVLTARGSSMAGLIEDGELMFVEPCHDYRGDGIYVLSVEDRLLVKRLILRVLDRQLSIEGTDGRAPELARLDDVGDRVLIHARVLGSWSLRRF